jgi:hypothetical protein
MKKSLADEPYLQGNLFTLATALEDEEITLPKAVRNPPYTGPFSERLSGFLEGRTMIYGSWEYAVAEAQRHADHFNHEFYVVRVWGGRRDQTPSYWWSDAPKLTAVRDIPVGETVLRLPPQDPARWLPPNYWSKTDWRLSEVAIYRAKTFRPFDPAEFGPLLEWEVLDA